MSVDEAVTTLQEFLADYLDRRGYFKAELAGVVPPNDDVPLILVDVYPANTDNKIVIVFGLSPDVSWRNPPAPVRQVAQESLDAAKAAHPHLAQISYDINFAN